MSHNAEFFGGNGEAGDNHLVDPLLRALSDENVVYFAAQASEEMLAQQDREDDEAHQLLIAREHEICRHIGATWPEVAKIDSFLMHGQQHDATGEYDLSQLRSDLSGCIEGAEYSGGRFTALDDARRLLALTTILELIVNADAQRELLTKHTVQEEITLDTILTPEDKATLIDASDALLDGPALDPYDSESQFALMGEFLYRTHIQQREHSVADQFSTWCLQQHPEIDRDDPHYQSLLQYLLYQAVGSTWGEPQSPDHALHALHLDEPSFYQFARRLSLGD